MAVGDSIAVTVNGASSFQPAAGVEVLITAWFGPTNGNQSIQMTGAGGDTYRNFGSSSCGITSAGSEYSAGLGNIKLFITNTTYIKFGVGGIIGGYSGVQIK